MTWTITGSGGDIATEERHELLTEVQYLDWKVQQLEDVVAQRDAVIDVLRAELVLEISLRTLGGTPPASTPLWINTNAKFSGTCPPPYAAGDTP